MLIVLPTTLAEESVPRQPLPVLLLALDAASLPFVALEPLPDHAQHVRNRGHRAIGQPAQQAVEPDAFGRTHARELTAPSRRQKDLEDPSIVGDDPAARATVAALVKGMKLEPVDLGPLRYARVLEEMLVIWANARGHGAAYNYYLRPEPKPN